MWELLTPALADLLDDFSIARGDIIEVPFGSGRKYICVVVDDVAKGFPNEYRMAVILKQLSWPNPIP